MRWVVSLGYITQCSVVEWWLIPTYWSMSKPYCGFDSMYPWLQQTWMSGVMWCDGRVWQSLSFQSCLCPGPVQPPQISLLIKNTNKRLVPPSIHRICSWERILGFMSENRISFKTNLPGLFSFSSQLKIAKSISYTVQKIRDWN